MQCHKEKPILNLDRSTPVFKALTAPCFKEVSLLTLLSNSIYTYPSNKSTLKRDFFDKKIMFM